MASQLAAAAGPAPQDRSVWLEQVQPGLAHLTYACALAPRMPNQTLTGEVAARLSEWVPQLCVAHGFRLEMVAIKPGYLQWAATVPVQAPPGQMMRVIRRQTSQRLLAEFPQLAQANPADDFWAPGCLLVNGVTTLPISMIDEYLSRLKKRSSPFPGL